MANIGPIGILEHIDDPLLTVIGDDQASMAGKTWISDATGAATNFVRAVAAGKGVHYYGVMNATNDSLLEFASAGLYFAAQEGHCMAEILIQFSSVADLSFSFGFNEGVEEGNMPMEISSSDVVSANAGTYVGLLYDDDSTDPDYLHCVWVNSSDVGQTDGNGRADGQTIQMKGMAPTAAKWLYMKVELQDRGSGKGARATFLVVDHNGRSVEKSFNTSITRSTPLCYHLAIEERDATGRNVFLRNCNWSQSIPDM